MPLYKTMRKLLSLLGIATALLSAEPSDPSQEAPSIEVAAVSFQEVKAWIRQDTKEELLTNDTSNLYHSYLQQYTTTDHLIADYQATIHIFKRTYPRLLRASFIFASIPPGILLLMVVVSGIYPPSWSELIVPLSLFYLAWALLLSLVGTALLYLYTCTPAHKRKVAFFRYLESKGVTFPTC